LTRVLHVVDVAPEQRLSGYTIRTRYVLEAQLQLGIEPSVLSLSDLPVDDPTSAVAGVPSHRPGLGRFRKRSAFLFKRRWRAAVEAVARECRAELIHAHAPFACAWPALDAARALDIPLLYEVRGLWHETKRANGTQTDPIDYRVRERLERRCCRAADAVVAISDGLRRHLESAYGVRHVHVVPNGVAYHAFADAPKGPPPPALEGIAGLKLGFVGSVRPLENLDVAVRGLRRLRDLGYDVSLVIVGDGTGLEALRGLAGSEGVADRVHILGRVPHEQIADYYAGMDLLVFPRARSLVSEIVTPLKPLEAMAMGKPVLVSDVGGLLELVGDAGLRFRAGDAQDFARVVGEVAADPGLAQATVPELRKRAQERDWLEVAKRYPPIYAEILGR